MYNYTELNQMGEERLRELARSMGIKKSDSTPIDDLVYQVLDNQAINEANDTTPEKKHPGRPKKVKADETADKNKSAETAEDKPKARKGPFFST